MSIGIAVELEDEVLTPPLDALVHYDENCVNCPDSHRALCGRQLHGVVVNGEDANCVVCVEMAKHGWKCPNCHVRVGG